MRIKRYQLIERVFWIAYIVIPMFTGILAYNWIPNESPEEGVHEILSSHEECDVYNQCGEIADAWRNIETGKLYTPSDFEEHRKKEGGRVFLRFIGYGLVGYFFFRVFNYFKKKKSLKNTSFEPNTKVGKDVVFEPATPITAPTTETLVDSEEDPILEYIKTLNPSEFPRVTALSNKEQAQIREVMNTVNKSFKKVYEVNDFKDFLVIYEKVLEKKANGEYKELLEEIHKGK